MPKASTKPAGPKANANAKRTEPYPKSSPKNGDKENVDPKPQDSTKPDDRRGDYRDTPLDEIKGEIPCYDDAATVRRKLKKLLTDKSIIPGTSKKWTQAAMVGEMQELESRGHAVPYNQNATGPTARSLGNFLKKTGKMGAGDSPCYYWGNIMLEKLRIWNGEKKSKPRLKAEEEYPGGYVREDASTKRVSMIKGGRPPAGAWEPRARGLDTPAPPMPTGPQPSMPLESQPPLPLGPQPAIPLGSQPPMPLGPPPSMPLRPQPPIPFGTRPSVPLGYQPHMPPGPQQLYPGFMPQAPGAAVAPNRPPALGPQDGVLHL